MNNLVSKNQEKTIVIDNFKVNETFNIEENGKLFLKIINLNNVKNAFLKINLKKNAKLHVSFADFSEGTYKVIAEVNLLETGASAYWDLASLATSTDKKEFDISFVHHAKETTADMQNYGVALNSSRLVFSGTNHITKDASKSNTNQSAKIIVFDKESSGKANPILRIDENDVIASHAAIVGRLNDEHLFYLKSRGLTEKQAKALIVYGYLKPITLHFDEKYQKKINKAIQEKCHV